jgi:uncharacterized membrane protein YgcG
MISTPLVILLAVASAAIVVALIRWKPRSRYAATRKDANSPARNWTLADTFLTFAASIGLARAQVERSTDGNPDGGHGWHGSHLDHGASGGFSDGGGFSGGDAGGGGI